MSDEDRFCVVTSRTFGLGSNAEGLVKSVHPFPARMAPGLALDSLVALPTGSRVLDPMAGSGTVLRQAIQLGHEAQGFDVDPLAVLMSSVWTRKVDDELIGRLYERLCFLAADVQSEVQLPWIDNETASFIDYWFAPQQREQLTKLAFGLHLLSSEVTQPEEEAAQNVLRLSLSRIIVTKEQAASLARDTSHSRPHRVATTSKYDVMTGYSRALRSLRDRLKDQPTSNANVSLGDARNLKAVETDSIDVVVTSPPYLNAIDYLRGHRLALVWLGWPLGQLRTIRSGSIGAERAREKKPMTAEQDPIVAAMLGQEELSTRHRGMVERYAEDLRSMLAEVSRVLTLTGRAVFVVGNSCLKGSFIRNADGVAAAAAEAGLKETDRLERELPISSRYLPVTGLSLAKRMRTETVLAFAAA
jgi:hypothetical protein